MRPTDRVADVGGKVAEAALDAAARVADVGGEEL